MGLDNLNSQLDREPDGFFDFIDDITVMVDRGKIIFPVIQPFGSHLRQKIGDKNIDDKYVFQELYDSTQTVARQMAEKNKFKLAGQYSSESGSEIQLNAINIPRGSVKVTAGGVTLTENTDYTVDYNMGTVRIINPALIAVSHIVNLLAMSALKRPSKLNSVLVPLGRHSLKASEIFFSILEVKLSCARSSVTRSGCAWAATSWWVQEAGSRLRSGAPPAAISPARSTRGRRPSSPRSRRPQGRP
jgi:hypothetical protein